MAAAPMKIGGVPEHFNMPWKIATERGLWAKHGAPEVEFLMVPGGTGAMLAGLRDGSYDVIIALTECLIAEIEQKDGVRLLANYVTSPLVWGVSVAPGSTVSSLDELEGKNFAISRYGSGSHVMAFVMAKQRGWTKTPTFTVCGNFATMIEKINAGECDACMWERFTTKPFVDAGKLKAVDGVPTPWPCFTSAALAEHPCLTDESQTAAVKAVIAAIGEACEIMAANEGNAIIERVCKDHTLVEEDAKTWFYGDEIIGQPPLVYADNKSHGGPTLSRLMMEECRDMLVASGVLDEVPEGETARDVASYCVPAVTTLVD